MTPADYFSIFRIVLPIAQFVFYLGGAAFFIKQIRKDLNGLGAKVRSVEAKGDDRFFAIALAIVLASPEAKRHDVASLLLNAFLRR